MSLFYSLSIFFYGLLLRLGALFHPKAKLMVKGWKTVFAELEMKLKNNKQQVVWFHCASLGEFEQGRPLMEKFRREFPSYKIVLTFFSPSGYEVRKNYAGADVICYLPLDTPGNAKRFMQLVKPSLAFYVKYEFWLNYLGQLRKNKVPHFLLSAIFREEQVFFKPWGNLFREALKGYSWIFTQEKKSLALLQTIGISNAMVAGDTRFDRVAEIAASAREVPIAKSFAGEERKVIVAGSSWPADEALLFPALSALLKNDWKLLIAPHELGEAHLSSIENGLVKNGIAAAEIVRYSKTNEAEAAAKKVLIIDNIGMLSSLYRYGRIAYIGGGFGAGIHNTLEAAVYGMPVIFGKEFRKFNEAKSLIEIGAGFSILNETELKNLLEKLAADPELLQSLSQKAFDFVQQHRGATEKILEKAKAIASL